MHRGRSSLGVTIRLSMVTALLSTGAWADGFDGSANLVCAALDVVGCVDGAQCLQGRAHTFDLPEFLVVDFKQKVLRATEESGIEEESPIKNQERTDEKLILQGMENHQGWSAAIDRKNGAITVVSAGKDVSLMIFGACTVL